MRKRLPSEKEPWMENYAIILRPHQTEKSVMIGSIGIPRLSHNGNAAEVGYGIHPDHWGCGYATEALELFVKYYWTTERMITPPTYDHRG
jgi:RimJ/RimL family protein N-acetyltransferase